MMALAREPGQRSKVAVAARQEGVDPVGACIGADGGGNVVALAVLEKSELPLPLEASTR